MVTGPCNKSCIIWLLLYAKGKHFHLAEKKMKNAGLSVDHTRVTGQHIGLLFCLTIWDIW